MDKGNVIDFVTFRSQNAANLEPKDRDLSQCDELGLALRNLIKRVREGNPIKQAHNIAISNTSSK